MAAAPAQPAYDFALCTALRPSLYGYACKLTRDRDAAHDIVQDTLLRAWRAWPRFEPKPGVEIKHAVSSWLHQIVHNEFVRAYRKAKVRAHLNTQSKHGLHGTGGPLDVNSLGSTGTVCPSARYGDASVAQMPASQTDGRTEVDGLGDELEAALGDLNPRHRKIVEMVGLHEGRYHEVAKALDVPIGTVMSSLHRARNRLIARLGRFAAAEYGISDQRESAEP